ncbi:MAG: S8 family serine peptidase [candidate division NC10 bacterium]|nr:S8 family serine peptidase [candidate division NC10 bacterium]
MARASARSRKKHLVTPLATAAPEARTVVYVHGIGNKPKSSVLKCQWDTALFGVPLGDRTRMAYWVNREYYPTPAEETCATGDLVSTQGDDVSAARIRAAVSLEGDLIEAEIRSLTSKRREQDVLRAVARKLAAREPFGTKAIGAAGPRAKVLPLPPFLRRWITQMLTQALLRDVNDFLFHEDRRERMERTLRERLDPGGGPFVVIAHSQGSMIAYDVLRQLTKEKCDVRLFVTIGSPLGLDEVQDVFRQWIGGNTLPVPPCVTRWVNAADWLDPVAVDHDLSNDFSPKNSVENHDSVGFNPDSPQHPHSATGYLRTDPVKSTVRETVGSAFAQAVREFVVARDLVEDLENARAEERHMVLIQLSSPEGTHLPAEVRDRLVKAIGKMVGAKVGEAEIEPLKRFVAARLTRSEIEHLRTSFKDLQIDKVWRNAVKKALIWRSAHTVQARPANMGYGAVGRNIRWAVLDTGIRADHPHFVSHKNVEAQWDCTLSGRPPKKVAPTNKEPFDKNGHGTHVAGVIAGRCEVRLKEGDLPEMFAGMAPEAKLYGYKVLDDQGNGRDSWIIKALEHIGDLNEGAGELVIHGINLSLGGSFDPSVYGCGHSPLCQELRRLWRQGVLTCLAAGNEGYAVLRAEEGVVEANMDLSIGDPANLDEAIAVGSIHKSNPHTYGVSYFSSRGPTADGRRKPDLVAPGERILSASHRFRTTKDPLAKDLFVEMSGTSMAAPHVSGVLAAFLSQRREFIGYPDRIKGILLDNCTDLGRDLYIQGRGMPNLVKMLANT